jgi:hypothetical protein
LHQADDGNQSAEEPEPSHGKITLPAKNQNQRGDGKQNRRGQQHLPRREDTGVWIEGSETRGPEHLPQVRAVGNESVCSANGEGELLEVADGMTRPLRDKRNPAAGSGENQQRDFFQQQFG